MRSNTSQRIPVSTVILAAAVLSLALTAAAWAGPGRAPAQQSTEAPRIEADGAAGVQVAIDPQTGKIRQPTPEERRALDEGFRSMFGKSLTSTAQSVTWPDGTAALEVGEEFTNVWVARINPDGSVSHACVDSAEAANAFVAGSSAPALEER